MQTRWGEVTGEADLEVSEPRISLVSANGMGGGGGGGRGGERRRGGEGRGGGGGGEEEGGRWPVQPAALAIPFLADGRVIFARQVAVGALDRALRHPMTRRGLDLDQSIMAPMFYLTHNRGAGRMVVPKAPTRRGVREWG